MGWKELCFLRAHAPSTGSCVMLIMFCTCLYLRCRLKEENCSLRFVGASVRELIVDDI